MTNQTRLEDQTEQCDCSCHVHPKWGPEGLAHTPYCWEECTEAPNSRAQEPAKASPPLYAKWTDCAW